MHELQVALALAVSMLIASTLVTMVVEIIYRVLHVRNFGLKFMLGTFYEDGGRIDPSFFGRSTVKRT
jgi:hypothetical protein